VRELWQVFIGDRNDGNVAVPEANRQPCGDQEPGPASAPAAVLKDFLQTIQPISVVGISIMDRAAYRRPVTTPTLHSADGLASGHSSY